MTFDKFFDARKLLHEDFFGGWEPDDLNLISPLLHKSSPRNEFILDCFGIYTRNYLHPWAAHLHSSARFEAPIPDDALRAEAIEYVALAHCLNATQGKRFSDVLISQSAQLGTIKFVAGDPLFLGCLSDTHCQRYVRPDTMPMKRYLKIARLNWHQRDPPETLRDKKATDGKAL